MENPLNQLPEHQYHVGDCLWALLTLTQPNGRVRYIPCKVQVEECVYVCWLEYRVRVEGKGIAVIPENDLYTTREALVEFYKNCLEWHTERIEVFRAAIEGNLNREKEEDSTTKDGK